MASFDILSKVDGQALDNAINVTRKEITNRFDFKGNHVVIDLNKKEYLIKLESESDMKIQQIIMKFSKLLETQFLKFLFHFIQ